jgi:hypothetical protein
MRKILVLLLNYNFYICAEMHARLHKNAGPGLYTLAI